jgi:hypothetical protein
MVLYNRPTLTRVGAVLSKTAIHRDTVGLEVLTEQLVATAAVEAGPAQLGVISDNSLADLEVLDLGSNGGDYADGLVAGDQRELWTG